jgi:predicted GTPase
MNVPVRMPRIAASGVRMRVESVAVRAGSAVRAGDVLLTLYVGNLPVTLHTEVIGVVKDVRAEPGMDLQPDRIILWMESPDLPPIKAVAMASTPLKTDTPPDPHTLYFQLPVELLASYTPVVRKVSTSANAVTLEIALGPARFEWRIAGAVAEVLVREGDSLPDGTAVARLAGAQSAAVVPPPPPAPPPLRETEIPELTLVEFQKVAHLLRDKVLALADVVSSAGLANSAELLRAEAARLADPRFSVAVVGEFKRGKSSFLNALAGGEFLPHDVIPCTAFACRFQYLDKLQLALVDKDGEEKLTPFETREEIIAELDRLTRDPRTTLREAIIRLPLPLCRDGVDLIDTPGLNDSEAMNRVTLGVLPNVDMAVLLLIPESPLSETERRFLEDHLMDRDVGRLVFVLNAKDRIAPDKLPRLEQYLRTQIDRILAEREAEKAPLYCVSSKQELEEPGLAGTGFDELRRQLSLLLFRQRGRLTLSQVLQRTGRAASEALASIKLRMAQVVTSREQFEASLDEVSRQLAATRLHANENRRRLGEAQVQANAIAAAQARFLYLALLGLRDSLPRTISADLLKARGTEEVKAQLSALLQHEAGKLYQQTLTGLMKSVREIHEPLSQSVRTFVDEAESAFSTLAGNVYQSAVGTAGVAPRTTTQLTTIDTADIGGGFAIQVDLSLRSMSWLFLVESSRDLLARTGLAASLESRAIAKLREDFAGEIERQVRENAGEGFLAARLYEIARRPFDKLLQSFNQEMKVLLDDTSATLSSLQSTAAGQGVKQSRQWEDLHDRVLAILADCDSVVFASRP